jgi:hypothetical protein
MEQGPNSFVQAVATKQTACAHSPSPRFTMWGMYLLFILTHTAQMRRAPGVRA